MNEIETAAEQQDVVIATAPLSENNFAGFYASYFTQVKMFLARQGCEPHSLDDLAQETFLRAWCGREHFSGKARFGTWVLGIARNTARESWRKRAIAKRVLDGVASEQTTGDIAEPDQAQAIRAAVNLLPPKQRMAITLVYLHGYPQRDAAIKANCAEDAFRRRLACGRRRLRKLLDGNK